MFLTVCFSLRLSETIFTISAVAPRLTGLQFITKAFIIFPPYVKQVKKEKAPKTELFRCYEDYLLEN